MSVTDLKTAKKESKQELAKLCDIIDEDLTYGLANPTDMGRKHGQLIMSFRETKERISKLIEHYSVHDEVDAIAKLKAEMRTCEEVVAEIDARISAWLREQSLRRKNPDMSETSVKLAAYDTSGSDNDQRDLLKKVWSPPCRKDIKRSVHEMCSDLGFTPNQDTTESDNQHKTSSPKSGKQVSFSEPVSSIEHSKKTAPDDDGSSPSSSDSSSEESSTDSDKGPLLSTSDVLGGLRGLKGARTISDVKKKKKKKSKKTDKSIDSYIQKLTLPVYDGNSDFVYWWSMFEALVDDVKQPIAIKFLRLKQSLKGDAYDLIKDFSHDKSSYREAKKLLYDTYGGLRRQNRRIYVDVECFPKITEFDFVGMKKLSGLVSRTVRQLEITNQVGEIGPSRLHSEMVAKMHPNTIYKYHDWITNKELMDDLYSVSQFLDEHSSKGIVALESSNRSKAKLKQKTKLVKSHCAQTVDKDSKSNSGEKPAAADTKPVAKNVGGRSRCRLCKIPGHPVWRCDKFLEMSVPKRWEAVKNAHVCIKCLSPAHHTKDCDRPPMICGIDGCKVKHNRLLHDKVKHKPSESAKVNIATDGEADEEGGATGYTAEDEQESSPVDTEVKTSMITLEQYKKRKIALGVTPVRVIYGGNEIVLTALLDTGSNVSLISEGAARFLGLIGEKFDSIIVGVGAHETRRRNLVCEVTIMDVTKSSLQTDIVEVVPCITGPMKLVNWRERSKHWPHLRDIKINSAAVNSKVELLIGLNFLHLLTSISSVTGPPGAPIAVHYPLGWVCMGPPSTPDTAISGECYFYHCNLTVGDNDLVKAVERLWDWDESLPESRKSTLDKQIEADMRKKMVYLNPGYQVSIPWVAGRPSHVSSNKVVAIRRLIQTEKKLRPKPLVAAEYCKMFQKYITKGYFRKVIDDLSVDGVCYLAHFPVIKLDRQTTKVRPVFDASDVFEGFSINDFEHAGPKLQQDLVQVLLRFRRYAVVLGCDISEMYLKVRVAPEDQPLQRVLWRNMDENAEIVTYEATRVMFGRKSSPFLALFVSLENAEKWKNEYPAAYEVIKESTYMDDSLDSVPSVSEALSLYKDLNFVWGEADMIPQKWISNNEEVLKAIPEDIRAVKLDLTKLDKPVGKMLGKTWNAKEDFFTFLIKIGDSFKRIRSKRTFLKVMAGIFDPLGFITPYTIRAKVYFQDMWVEKFTWDEILPDKVVNAIQKWVVEAEKLTEVQVNRVLFERGKDMTGIMLHIFSDASTRAYGCVAYVVDYVNKYVRLVMSKSKIAPVKLKGMPRLELQGAVMAAKLGKKLRKILNLTETQTRYWVDNQDVLYWVKSVARVYKPFVAHRITTIQECTSTDNWMYVPSLLNPADVLSRGCTGEDLVTHPMWWTGPQFILQNESEWPVQPDLSLLTGLEQRKTKDWAMSFTLMAMPRYTLPIELANKSSLNKALRVLTYIYRFTRQCSGKGPIKATELDFAMKTCIRAAQSDEWYCEMRNIMERNSSTNRQLKVLSPWVDEDNVVRNSTRLVDDPFIPWEESNPIILPTKHKLTRLIILEIHKKNQHAGMSFCLSEFRKTYTAVGIRELIRWMLRELRIVEYGQHSLYHKEWEIYHF